MRVSAHHVLSLRVGWGGQGQLYKIQKLINFSARIVTGVKKHQHITPALNSLAWPRIEALVARRDVIKVWKLLRSEGAPAEIRALLTHRTAASTREMRASDSGSLHLSRRNLSVGQKAFSYRAASTWNALPPSARAAPTLGAFKTAVYP